MRLIKRFIAVLMLLGGCFLGAVAFMEAGGRIPEGLAKNDAPLATAGMAVLLICGLLLMIATRKPKPKK